MTQEELNNKIAELEKQLAELKQVKVEEPKQKRWKPENGELYFYAGYDCCKGSSFSDYDELDKWNYLTGNCFETPEETKEYRTKFEIRAKYRKFIEEHTEPLDWEDGRAKWYLTYVYNDIGESISFTWGNPCQGTIYASSKEIIEQAIDYIGGEEVAKKYLFD